MGAMSSEELSGDERRGGVPRALARPINGGREELAVAGHDAAGATGGGGCGGEARARLGVALLVVVVFSGRRGGGGGGDAAAGRAYCEGGGGRGRGLERPEVGELLLEALVLVGEALAPALEVLAVDLRLLELGPGAAVLEPHLHLPRPEAQAGGQRQLLLLQRQDETKS